MRKVAFTGLVALVMGAASVQAQAPARGSFAFVNVNVIPMDRERVVANQTVIVQDGKITAVGPAASTTVPAGATHIDGAGKYLIPGLAEMHGHIPANPAAAEDVLFMYIAAGATTVRGMQGNASQVDLRRRVRAGELIGPRMWLAAPPMSGQNTPTPASGEEKVRLAKEQGFDLLKVHEGLTPETYAAITKAASAAGLPWGGHVSDLVGVRGALEAKQSTIDHLDNYFEDTRGDESQITQLVKETKAAGVAVVPTQILWEVLRGARDVAPMAARAENRYMARATITTWTTQATQMRTNADPAAAAREVTFRNKLLKAMDDGGVMVLMGTDAPQVFSVPGFSLHRELPVMVDAGMSPWRVLVSGTTSVAKFFGTESTAGTIAAGKNADLVLLDANPLTDIRAIERTAGVMYDGRWLSASAIRTRLEAIATKNGG